MVLQVLDLVTPSGEPFYGDCPVPSYTNLDINTTGHTTCTVIPQGIFQNFCKFFQLELWKFKFTRFFYSDFGWKFMWCDLLLGI